jgi:hypothetical protein
MRLAGAPSPRVDGIPFEEGAADGVVLNPTRLQAVQAGVEDEAVEFPALQARSPVVREGQPLVREGLREFRVA